MTAVAPNSTKPVVFDHVRPARNSTALSAHPVKQELSTRQRDALEEKRASSVYPQLKLSFTKKAQVKPVGFQWFLDIKKDGCIVESVQLGYHTNRTLELKFRQNLDTFSYTVEKSSTDPSDIHIRSQLPDMDHTAEYRRVSTVAGRPIVLPQFWSPVQNYTCQMFPVAEESEEFKKVEEMFRDTMPDAKIQVLQRIQNLLTLHKYYAENRKIASECYSTQPAQTEHLLFHGTKNLSPTAIISSQEGFDTRLASSQNLWGPATYFAEDASYADKYAFRTGPTTRQMMVASVAVGSCFDYGTLCNPTLNQPPIDVHNKGRYHSVSGITKDSRVYAIFNSNQCLPQYVITYSLDE